MDGTAPKIYHVDQEHCEHDFEFIEIVHSASYPYGIHWELVRCKKCGYEMVKLH